MPRRLLLISNSTNHGQGYLDHVLSEIDGFLGPIRRLVFVPFALKDQTAYGATAAKRLAAIGIEVQTLTADEARYAATLLFERGLPYSVVANRIGVSGATMQDWFPEQAVPSNERQARPRGTKREPRAPRQPRQPARCGTKAGYHAHYRRGEKPCDPCREAKTVAHRHYRKHGTYVGAPEVAA